MPVRAALLSCGMAARAKPAKRKIPNPPCETSFLVIELTVSLREFLPPASVRQFASTLSTLAPRALEETRCTRTPASTCTPLASALNPSGSRKAKGAAQVGPSHHRLMKPVLQAARNSRPMQTSQTPVARPPAVPGPTPPPVQTSPLTRAPPAGRCPRCGPISAEEPSRPNRSNPDRATDVHPCRRDCRAGGAKPPVPSGAQSSSQRVLPPEDRSSSRAPRQN